LYPRGNFRIFRVSFAKLEVPNGFGYLIGLLAFFDLLRYCLRLGKGLQPRVFQQHGVGGSHLGYLVETA
jgi:hypothetical protein